MKKTLLFVLIQILTFNLYSQCGSGEIVKLDSQSKVNSFLEDYCEDFLGTLFIADDNDGQDNIINLTPLLSLKKVYGPLLINGNIYLTSLAGLDSLTFAGSLNVIDNPLINNLNGLNKLSSVYGDIFIFGNDSLLDLDALNALTTVESFGGVLTISRNQSLVDITGLSNLSSLISGIRIIQNKLLTSLVGLHNLMIHVDPNSGLLTENITITNNKLLTDCSIRPVCEALSKDEVTFNIENNDENCNSSTDILTNCDISSTHIMEESIFNVYPNPFLDVINIESKISTNLILINSIGQSVIQVKLAEGINTIDLSNLDKGFYILHAQEGYSRKMIKL